MGLVFIGSEETFSVEVNQVCWRIGDPNLCFPGDVAQVFQHGVSVNKGRHKYQSG